MPLTGGCQCGSVRYEIAVAEPDSVYVCHCRECRHQSASAFGISVIVPAAAFVVRQGELRTWRRPTDSGNVLDCRFCAACGSRVVHANPGGAAVSVKGGSLDEAPDLARAVHIWVSRKLAGVVIPAGAVTFPEEPP